MAHRGTPGYRAPEMLSTMGTRADPSLDIFALGCFLFRLVTKDRLVTLDGTFLALVIQQTR